MIGLKGIRGAAAETGLGVVGAFHAGAADKVPDGIRTVLLLGPDGPRMWEVFSESPEFQDDAPHPLDLWSRRVVSDLAARFGGEPMFPFSGPPWHAFQHWAERGEGAVVSPVSMQASPIRGLWASFRGAVGFAQELPLPGDDRPNPCAPCAAPCRTACPVGAFESGTYDVPKCVAHVNSEAGIACRTGCLVRRSCPAGTGMNLPEAQRAFHMAAFLRAQSGA